MFALGLQGSPRRKGNTAYLLGRFMEELEKKGVSTQVVEAARINVNACMGCGNCERTGFCVFDDDMKGILALMRKADIIVLATPMYFFNATSQLKRVIDRSQTFWSRKYRFNLKDSKSAHRKGILLAMGGSPFKSLFDGIRLTAGYFFDAVGADFLKSQSLTYRKMENPDDLRACSSVDGDVKASVEGLLRSFSGRNKKILFAGRTNTGLSVAAAVFARMQAGDRVEVFAGGLEPGAELNSGLVTVMGRKVIGRRMALGGKGMVDEYIDLGFTNPESIHDALGHAVPDLIVQMGCGDLSRLFPGVRVMDLDLPDITGESEAFIEKVCDDLEERVKAIVSRPIHSQGVALG